MMGVFFLILSSCSFFSKTSKIKNQGDNQSPAFLEEKFKKICVEGAGRGRIELVNSKYTFTYESLINHRQNIFELALDFSMGKEVKLSLALNPKDIQKQMDRSQLIALLKEKLGPMNNREEILKAMREFFIFTADFIHSKAKGKYPLHYLAEYKNDHFILKNKRPLYLFEVDNYSEGEKYFERTVFRMFFDHYAGSEGNQSLMTLFLVPGTCDK